MGLQRGGMQRGRRKYRFLFGVSHWPLQNTSVLGAFTVPTIITWNGSVTSSCSWIVQSNNISQVSTMFKKLCYTLSPKKNKTSSQEGGDHENIWSFVFYLLWQNCDILNPRFRKLNLVVAGTCGDTLLISQAWEHFWIKEKDKYERKNLIFISSR